MKFMGIDDMDGKPEGVSEWERANQLTRAITSSGR
jgi:hypothetical protein